MRKPSKLWVQLTGRDQLSQHVHLHVQIRKSVTDLQTNRLTGVGARDAYVSKN